MGVREREREREGARGGAFCRGSPNKSSTVALPDQSVFEARYVLLLRWPVGPRGGHLRFAVLRKEDSGQNGYRKSYFWTRTMKIIDPPVKIT